MFNKKTWTNRESEYPNRRRIVDLDTSAEQIVNVYREEGTISQTGDAFSADNMNDLETRVYNETRSLEWDFAYVQSTSTVQPSDGAYSAGTYFMYNGSFYVTTQAIAVGDTIQPGVNCTQTSVGVVLKTLNTSLANTTSSLTNSINSVNNSLNATINNVNGRINTINSNLTALTSTVATKPRLVTFSPTLTFVSGAASYTVDLSQYTSETTKYIPVMANGVGINETFSVAITNATVASYTVSVRGNVSSATVLLAFYIV